MSVKYISFDPEQRTATFEVNGELMTRPIANHVKDEDLRDHLIALSIGLANEFEPKPTLSQATPFPAGEVLI